MGPPDESTLADNQREYYTGMVDVDQHNAPKVSALLRRVSGLV